MSANHTKQIEGPFTCKKCGSELPVAHVVTPQGRWHKECYKYLCLYCFKVIENDGDLIMLSQPNAAGSGYERGYHIDCYNEMLDKAGQAYREELLKAIRKYKSFSQDQLREYIDECEHQDGYQYWLQFKDWKQLAADIRMYVEAK